MAVPSHQHGRHSHSLAGMWQKGFLEQCVLIQTQNQSKVCILYDKTITILILKIKKDPNYVLAKPWGLLVQHVLYWQTKAVS